MTNIHPSTIPADNPPPPMGHDDRTRARTAAIRVKRQYPGPPGEVMSREITACADMGFRLDQEALIRRLIDHILDTPAAGAA